jgi:SAM-dependent methyltransferase
LTRDEGSAEVVKRLGVSAPLELGVDAAVLGVGEAAERQPGPVLGVTVRSWHFPGVENADAAQRNYEDAVVDAASAWQEETGGLVRFVSNCTSMGGYRFDDRVVARRVAARLTGAVVVVEEEELSFQAVRGLAASCDLLLGTRMHSLIFATTAGVPAVGIAYEAKTQGWLSQLGLGDRFVPIERPEGLTELVLRAWAEREADGATVRQHLPGICARAEAQLDTLAQIAEGHRPASRSVDRQRGGWESETWSYDAAHRRLRLVADLVLGEGGARVLDVGCSTGLLGRMLGPTYDYTGVDVASSVAVDEPRFRVGTADLNQGALPEGSWEVVVCSGVLEYLDDMQGMLASIRSRLVPGGLAVITLFNLAHVARAVGRPTRHAEWRFEERPDELALHLIEAGLRPVRVVPSAAGYGPAQAIGAEHRTSHDLQGGGQLGPARQVRLAHQIVAVCRASEPMAGPRAIDDLAGAGELLQASKAAVELVRAVPWSARAWSDLGVLFHHAGMADRGRNNLLTALRIDPSPVVLNNLQDLGIDPVAEAARDPGLAGAELRYMLDPDDPGACLGLQQALVQMGHLHAAAQVKALGALRGI